MRRLSTAADNGLINYNEFANVLFNPPPIPPPVVIPEELKPFWDALKSKEAGKNKAEPVPAA